MNKHLLSFALIFISAVSYGQSLDDNWYDLNFEDTATIGHLRIDSIMNQNNLWQVGTPQKTVFTSAYSSPRAIVTDTINPYPINDTSSFEIINLATGDGWWYPHTVILAGYYQVDSDTLSDYGTIEISPDNGTTWIDLINDTVYTQYYQWWTDKPVLTGNSNGWQPFRVWLAPLGPLFNVQINDTILYRFTFVSDSVQTNRDGLMFDDFHFEDWAERIQEFQNDDMISIAPNPSSNELRVRRDKVCNNSKIQILDYTGKILYNNLNFNGETIDTRQLVNGIYLLKYSEVKYFSIRRFVVQH